MKTLSRAYISQFLSLVYFNFARISSQPFFSLQNKPRERVLVSRRGCRNGTLRRNRPHSPSDRHKNERIISPLREKRTTPSPDPAPGDEAPGSPVGAGSAPAAPRLRPRRPARSPFSRRLRLQNSSVGKKEPAPPNPRVSGQK